MDDALMERAKRYRLRAEECRTAGEGMSSRESHEIFRHIAADYDLLADTTEARARRAPAQHTPRG